MISVAVLSSIFRLDQLDDVLSHLDKTHVAPFVVYDQFIPTDHNPAYDAIAVKRSGRFYCRGKVWDAAINHSKTDRLMILDGDRIPHPMFIEIATYDKTEDILFIPKLVNMESGYTHSDIMDALNHDRHNGIELRMNISMGTIGPYKNPMSGCVSFTKSVYHSFGGMSHDFVGWGYNDLDCYITALNYGCNFRSVDTVELHLFHDYEINRNIYLSMNLYNAVRFYHKWKMPIHQTIVKAFDDFDLTIEDAKVLSMMAFIEKAMNVKPRKI